MKKILLILMIIFFTGNAYGVSSDDVYLRKDVFEAKMDAFMAEIRLMNMDLRREMDKRFSEVDKHFNALDKKIDNVKTELHQEIQDVKTELQKEIQTVSSKVDLLDERTRGTERTVYWGLAFFGIFIVLVSFAPGIASFLQTLRKPQLTIEDVEKIFDKKFELLNARFAAK